MLQFVCCTKQLAGFYPQECMFPIGLGSPLCLPSLPALTCKPVLLVEHTAPYWLNCIVTHRGKASRSVKNSSTKPVGSKFWLYVHTKMWERMNCAASSLKVQQVSGVERRRMQSANSCLNNCFFLS